MNICISESLINAVEVAKHLINKEEINPAQGKNLRMALSLIMLCKKFFDININQHELDILKEWEINSEDITKLFLARKQDKCFLYGTFINSGVKALGIFIPDEEINFIQEMNNKNVLDHFNKIVLTT